MGKLIIDNILGDLSRLSGTGLTNEDEDLGLLVELEEFIAMFKVSK